MKRFNSKETVARIRELRTTHGLTQEKLSEMIGYGHNYIARVECGSRSCSIDLLITLAEFFGVSLDYLILGKTCEPTIASDLDDIIKKLQKVRKLL